MSISGDSIRQSEYSGEYSYSGEGARGSNQRSSSSSSNSTRQVNVGVCGGGANAARSREAFRVTKTEIRDKIKQLPKLYREKKFEKAKSIIEYVVEHGGTDLKYSGDRSALCTAVQYGHLAGVKYLVEVGGADLTLERIHSRRTALEEAIHRRCTGRMYFEIIQYLLLKGSNPNHVCAREFSSIHYALVKSPRFRPNFDAIPRVVKMLINYGAKRVDGERTVEHFNKRGEDTYRDRAEVFDVEGMVLIGEEGENTVVTNTEPDWKAIYDTVGKLMDAYESSVHDKVNEFIDYLISIGQVNYNNLDRPAPILLAIEHGDLEGLKVLTQQGADTNVTRIRGEKTALELAIIREDSSAHYAEIIELLIENGADVNAKRPGGLAPMEALFLKYSDKESLPEEGMRLLNLLIDSGAQKLDGQSVLRESSDGDDLRLWDVARKFSDSSNGIDLIERVVEDPKGVDAALEYIWNFELHEDIFGEEVDRRAEAVFLGARLAEDGGQRPAKRQKTKR